MQRTECGEKTLKRCVWVAWLIAVCNWEEACSWSPSSTGSNPIHWSWLLCLWYHTRSENHDDKGVPLSWALHRLLNPHKSVEEPRLKISTRICRFRIVVLVRVIKFFYHGTWHYFFLKYVRWYPAGITVCLCFFSQFCDVVTLIIIHKEI
jgi:hypothetical protein